MLFNLRDWHNAAHKVEAFYRSIVDARVANQIVEFSMALSYLTVRLLGNEQVAS